VFINIINLWFLVGLSAELGVSIRKVFLFAKTTGGSAEDELTLRKGGRECLATSGKILVGG